MSRRHPKLVRPPGAMLATPWTKPTLETADQVVENIVGCEDNLTCGYNHQSVFCNIATNSTQISYTEEVAGFLTLTGLS